MSDAELSLTMTDGSVLVAVRSVGAIIRGRAIVEQLGLEEDNVARVVATGYAALDVDADADGFMAFANRVLSFDTGIPEPPGKQQTT